jgi:hypothetical protein
MAIAVRSSTEQQIPVIPGCAALAAQARNPYSQAVVMDSGFARASAAAPE